MPTDVISIKFGVADYLRQQTAIESRAQQIGRIIQGAKHYAMGSVLFPCVSSYVQQLLPEIVSIVIGLTETRDLVIINVPVPMFETATETDITVWVGRQNTHYMSNIQSTDTEAAKAKQDAEIEMLRELQKKYPEESM